MCGIFLYSSYNDDCQVVDFRRSRLNPSSTFGAELLDGLPTSASARNVEANTDHRSIKNSDNKDV